MTSLALVRKSFAILAFIIALSALSGPAPTSALTTTISGNPGTTYVIVDTLRDTGATVAEYVPANLYYNEIKVSSAAYLRVGWEVKIDGEYMTILNIIDNTYPTKDVMVVNRLDSHPAVFHHDVGAPIQYKTVTVNIWANNVGDPTAGAGAYELYVTLPESLEYINLTYDGTWLGSTGRMVTCFEPFKIEGTRTWRVGCSTWGATPPGPTGSGLLAKLTVLPEQVPALNTISLAGSYLTKPSGGGITATIQNPYIRTLECPDVNLDGRITVTDSLNIQKNLGDEGVDSGAALASAVDSSQTTMDITDIASLVPNDTISLDNELLTVNTLTGGGNPNMTVTRPINNTVASAHAAGTKIYRGTVAGTDGKYGYTATRDVDHNTRLTVTDALVVAKVLGMTCPAP